MNDHQALNYDKNHELITQLSDLIFQTKILIKKEQSNSYFNQKNKEFFYLMARLSAVKFEIEELVEIYSSIFLKKSKI